MDKILQRVLTIIAIAMLLLACMFLATATYDLWLNIHSKSNVAGWERNAAGWKELYFKTEKQLDACRDAR